MLNAAVLALAFWAAPAEASKPPARAEAYYHFSEGVQAWLKGDAEGALSEYRKAQRLDPAAVEIRVEIARVLREMERLDEALAESQAAVRAAPDHAGAHLELAYVHERRGQQDGGEQALRQAAAEFEEVLRLDPKSVFVLHNLATLYGRLQDHKGAIRAWEQIAELDIGNPVEAYLHIGSHALAVGDSERAASALQQVVELQPNSPRAYEQLGRIYAAAQQRDQAILNYRKALEIDRGNLRVRLALGETLFQARRFREALAESDAVLSSDANNRFALELKGRCLRDLKEFDAAWETAEKLVAQDPRDTRAGVYLKVTIAESRRDFVTAAALLQELLGRSRRTEDPDDAEGNDRMFLVHLGYAQQQLNRYAEAAEAFARAKAVGGEPDVALLGYEVEALILAKQLPRALEAVQAARKRFPDSPDLASQEATILRERGDLKAATEIVESLRRRSPREVDVLLEVADFYQRAKRLQEAEAVLREARELEPRNLRLLFQLGAVLERLKRHDEAEGAFREALNIQPDSPAVLNYLGYMNADRNVRVEDALALIERALALDPENGAYLDSQAWALYRLNRFQQAETSLRKALDKNGAVNAVVLDHMGDILQRLGRLSEAMDFWHRALDGEDEGEELDRIRVQAKIRETEATLEAQSHKPDPRKTP